jgi:ABC-type dipeptide/oligopeptide/nickel transport system permease subunit
MGRNAATAAARRRLKLLTGAILFLMWAPFFRLALEQSVADFGLATIYADAYLLLRESVWWWVVSILFALSFEVFLAARVGDSLRSKFPRGIEGEAVAILNRVAE